MFRSCCEWVQANQPVSTTGVIAHSARWVTAMNGDLILTNPRVNKSAPTTTIYCIHGTADYNAAFLLVANRLLPKLPDSIEAIHLCAFESRFKGIGIDDFANQLKDKIQANGHQDVILMGHSRGGLVAAYFTENLAQDSHVNVKAVFAICSPFQGADLAKNPLFTWLSTSVAQMQKEVNSTDEMPPSTPSTPSTSSGRTVLYKTRDII